MVPHPQRSQQDMLIPNTPPQTDCCSHSNVTWKMYSIKGVTIASSMHVIMRMPWYPPFYFTVSLDVCPWDMRSQLSNDHCNIDHLFWVVVQPYTDNTPHEALTESVCFTTHTITFLQLSHTRTTQVSSYLDTFHHSNQNKSCTVLPIPHHSMVQTAHIRSSVGLQQSNRCLSKLFYSLHALTWRMCLHKLSSGSQTRIS